MPCVMGVGLGKLFLNRPNSARRGRDAVVGLTIVAVAVVLGVLMLLEVPYPLLRHGLLDPLFAILIYNSRPPSPSEPAPGRHGERERRPKSGR